MATPKNPQDRLEMIQAITMRLHQSAAYLTGYAQEGVDSFEEEEHKDSAYDSAKHALEQIRAEIEALYKE